MSKPILKLYRGLPGSGKTTSAIKWRGIDPANRALVSRDDFRSMFNGAEGKVSDFEDVITSSQKATVRSLLASGVSVGLHDTNLPRRRVREWLALAESEGADWEVEDLTHEPLEVCLARNLGRPYQEQVPPEVVQGMWKRYCKGQPDPQEIEWVPVGAASELEVEPYKPDASLPTAYLCDIDGTLALMQDRGPHEYHRVGEDWVNFDVTDLIDLIYKGGGNVILMSGRPESCRAETERWLMDWGIPFDELHMRTDQEQKDGIADDTVKLRLFNEYARHDYDIRGVFDDRNRVVKLWRKLGLTCFQVAEGSF